MAGNIWNVNTSSLFVFYFFVRRKWLIIVLIGSLGLSSCRSTAMPCPKISVKQKKKGIFSSQKNQVKYDNKGRVKK